MSDGLQLRDATTQTDERIDTRVLEVRVATVNEDDRTVEAVLSSDRAVEMWDWRVGEVVDEILLNEGVDIPRQVPLLAAHSRYSLNDVLGSVRNITTEDGDDGAKSIVGRMYFADGDDEAERAWNKVRQGHLTDVSIGYRIDESTDIPKGQTAKVNGREFHAKTRRLRIATKWRLKEASIVPIGADQSAKTRNDTITHGGPQMDPKLRAYLESIGLRADATNEDAWQFLAGLEGDQRSAAQNVMLGINPQQQQREEQDHEDDEDDDAEERGAQRERARIAMIRERAGSDVPQTVIDQAISEGWDEGRVNERFLEAVRGQRMREAQQAPFGQGIDRGSRVSHRSLAAGLMIASGVDPVGREVHDGRRASRSERLSEQDADYGDEFRGMSAVDLVRECARLDNQGRVIRDPGEAFRAAISGTSLDRVFTTNIYAHLRMGWDEIPDTTSWCEVEDVPNFMQNEDITLRGKAAMERHPRGATAKHATAEDDYETYKVYRFAKQFVADEQDIIDDRLGALMQMPREMGAAARRVRPDMVYSILLANNTLTATGGALFNSTAETTSGGHANLGSTALGSAGLKAAITAMMAHRLNPNSDKVPLNIRPAFLIVPPDLEWTGRELLTSGEVRDTTANTKYATINVLRDVGLSLVVDTRVNATGCTDPVSGTTSTGSATNYFLAAARRTVKVAYRRGTGRSPQLRSFVLTQGQWGMGWDINLDIGAAAVDYRGLYKGNS